MTTKSNIKLLGFILKTLCERYGVLRYCYALLYPTRTGQCITSVRGVTDFMTAYLPWAKYIVFFRCTFFYQKTLKT